MKQRIDLQKATEGDAFGALAVGAGSIKNSPHKRRSLPAESAESAPSVIARCVFETMASVDLEALTERAGSHSWGYVEPTEAAEDLLEEVISDWDENMEEDLKAGQMSGAERWLIGIVAGLYRARSTRSDGALGWAPDFPADHAGCAVREFLKLCGDRLDATARERVMKALYSEAPEWTEMLRRSATQSAL